MVTDFSDFTSVNNDIARNSSLSLTAKGLYLSILWFLDNNIGAIKKERIRKKFANEDDSFEEAWDELKSNGYLWGIDEGKKDDDLQIPVFLMKDERFNKMSSDAKILYSVMISNSLKTGITNEAGALCADISKIKYPFNTDYISEVVEYGLAEEVPNKKNIYSMKYVEAGDDE